MSIMSEHRIYEKIVIVHRHRRSDRHQPDHRPSRQFDNMSRTELQKRN